ncbi:hypothetical protein SAMN02745146_2597 [Hymenobacter daecheongensis DSM 21074]|uniref:Tetratricopeptide repeat-containing protein n=1 Tax=Hymenobacter daecheongensis DSM 21074 TaxID=1121955 RepID=A0A1M6HQP2_9BACT|nr:hypothetical protein [Hymenobacter daecheongensis]SHJ24515.1 hypothetical protein SAMN02745146_2597 [Hymenobacter daecheongensis DSM 21074]
MTRASLLHILDHVNGISEAEIRELEQLAAAFPYCQTAHILLAKAAHDRGNMLASQRLRRAATYAADRDLLRHLIEDSAPATAQAIDLQTPPAKAPEQAEPLAVAEMLPTAAPDSAVFAPVADPESPDEPRPTNPDSIDSAAEVTPEEPGPELAEVLAEPASSSQEVSAAEVEAAAVEELLPAVAPPIRPPVEAGAARFEFGLAEQTPEIPPVYQLPTLDDDDHDAVSPAAALVIPAFQADAALAYALGGSSRLGHCLQLRDELTHDLPTDDFFAPDALLLAHLRAHTPPAPLPSRSSFDLINKFLRAQPRLKAPTLQTPAAEEQADLSVRSLQGVPDLASESLAKIMVRQGKIGKAIEIYERLIVRQPEKKAYFADQIQQLKPSE